MTTTAEFLDTLRAEAATGRNWWTRAAAYSLSVGWWHPIVSHHDGSRLYIARFWLDEPRLAQDPQQLWESGNSRLLHFILEPDDDPASHCHPWRFSSNILTGGYSEEIPPSWWCPEDGLGPPLWHTIRTRSAGAYVDHRATDLHRIVAVQPGTVSLVHTGPREREWGFMPPGKPWVDRATYLGTRPRLP